MLAIIKKTLSAATCIALVIACFLPFFWPLESQAPVNIYVDTDNGNNSNNGMSWLLAKADLYHALAIMPTPLPAPYIIHCKGATADTQPGPGYDNQTTSTNTLTIQVDAADRHRGKWDNSKYHLVVTDQSPLSVSNAYENIIGLQIEYIGNTATFKHGISIQTVYTTGTINVASNIIKGTINYVSANDDVGIHTSGAVGLVTNIWNNVIYGWVNGSFSDLIGIAAYGLSNIHNNTIYNCYTGLYNGTGTINKLLSNNNLFVSVTRPLAGNAPGTYAAGTDYNATDGSALLFSPMTVTGGDGAHEQLNISTSNLFVDAANGDFNLTRSTTSQVRRAGLYNPGTGLFNDDIAGTARVTPWDIGAFQAPLTFAVRHSMREDVQLSTDTSISVPTFFPPAGTASNTISAAIQSGSRIICYTDDGATPAATTAGTCDTGDGHTKLYSGAISITGNTTLKALGTRAGWVNTAVATAAYVFTVATPTATPPAGSYFGTQSITLATATSGAVIHYRTTAPDATCSDATYSTPISVPSDETITAIACKGSYNDSAVLTAAYVIHAYLFSEPFDGGSTSCASGKLSHCSNTGVITGTGTYDLEYATSPAPFAGTYSLGITTSNFQISYPITGHVGGKIIAATEIGVNGTPATTTALRLNNSGNTITMASIQLVYTAGHYNFRLGYNRTTAQTLDCVTTMQPGELWYTKVEYTPGSGADAALAIYAVKDASGFPGWGSACGTVTDGTDTANVANLRLISSAAGLTTIFDLVRVALFDISY